MPIHLGLGSGIYSSTFDVKMTTKISTNENKDKECNCTTLSSLIDKCVSLGSNYFWEACPGTPEVQGLPRLVVTGTGSSCNSHLLGEMMLMKRETETNVQSDEKCIY